MSAGCSGSDYLKGIGGDVNARRLLYGTENGSYQFRITSDGNIFGSPNLGDHGVISGFGQTGNTSAKLGALNYIADNTTTSLIIGASKGYAVNEGWIEGFTPEERTLTNGKQSLTLGKDTWIILTASDAVGNIAMGSSYKTGALSLFFYQQFIHRFALASRRFLGGVT